MAKKTTKKPPQLKGRELIEAEKLLDELTRPMFVWRMARSKLTGDGNHNRSVERLKRINALGEVIELLAKHGYRRPRSTAGYYMGFTQRTGSCHIIEVDDGHTSLCGRNIVTLVRRMSDDEPVKLASHWENGSVTFEDQTMCTTCVKIVNDR